MRQAAYSLVLCGLTIALFRYREARGIDLAAQGCLPDAARAHLEDLGRVALQIFGDAVANTEAIGEASPWRRPAARRVRLDSQATRTAVASKKPSPLTRNLKFVLHTFVNVGQHSNWTTAVTDAAEWLEAAVDALLPRTILRLGVAGGNRSLHHILNALTLVKSRRPELTVNLCIYLLPIKVGDDNALAEFIGKFDCWYARHILIPCMSSLPCCPHILPPRDDGAADPQHGAAASAERAQPSVSPLSAMRSLVQSYCRHAKMPLEVHLSCICRYHAS